MAKGLAILLAARKRAMAKKRMALAVAKKNLRTANIHKALANVKKKQALAAFRAIRQK
jgi:hypothetical protein